MLQIKEVTESWQHNSPLNITNFETCTSVALDYLKITHPPLHDTLRITSNHSNTASLQPFLKDTLVSMLYYNKTSRREITEAHQLEQVCHQWLATRRETKLLLPINHSQAINTLYLHFKAPAATLELSSSTAQSNTYHQ